MSSPAALNTASTAVFTAPGSVEPALALATADSILLRSVDSELPVTPCACSADVMVLSKLDAPLDDCDAADVLDVAADWLELYCCR